MERLYSAPLRVYLLLLGMALAGIYAGLNLPVSLYPNSSKPTIRVFMEYGSNTPEEFLHAYGNGLEAQLRAITTGKLKVEKVSANYGSSNMSYGVDFEWDSPGLDALHEVQNVVN